MNSSNVVDSTSKQKLIGKNPFLYFEFIQLPHLNPNLEVNQNLQYAISHFIPNQFQI